MSTVLFDIDRTIFDTDAFGLRYTDLLAEEVGVTKQEIAAVKETYYTTLEQTTDFDPKDFLQLIVGRLGGDFDRLWKVFYENPLLYTNSVYADTTLVLEQLQIRHSLGIFSEGNGDYQMNKLSQSGLKRFFDEDLIFIHKRKMSEVAVRQIPKEAIVADDKAEVVAYLKANGVVSGLVDRKIDPQALASFVVAFEL